VKIPKAIEILTRYGKDYLVRMEEDFDDAVKLGREALKAISADRGGDASLLNRPLPGETEE